MTLIRALSCSAMASLKFGAAVRQFSTTATRAKLVQAPIQVYGWEGRYAHALYSAASKQKQLDKVETEMNSLQSLLKTDVKFANYIGNPSLKVKEKVAALEFVSQKLNYTDTTKNFCCSLAEHSRLNKLGSVIDAFATIMRAQRGEVACSVTTAKPLDAAQGKELQAALKGFLKKGETIQLETKVDPSIIGGMVVTIGDKYVDMSMASKIKKYTKLIEETV